MGMGIGATQVGNETISPALAAGRPPMVTFVEPFATIPGPAGTHPSNEQDLVWSETLAAAIPLMKTVGHPGGIRARGTGGWGTAVGVGAGGWMGAWQCGPS